MKRLSTLLVATAFCCFATTAVFAQAIRSGAVAPTATRAPQAAAHSSAPLATAATFEPGRQASTAPEPTRPHRISKKKAIWLAVVAAAITAGIVLATERRCNLTEPHFSNCTPFHLPN